MSLDDARAKLEDWCKALMRFGYISIGNKAPMSPMDGFTALPTRLTRKIPAYAA
jgi:hypothetical protein